MEPLMGNMSDTQRSRTVSTKQKRIAEVARARPQEALTSLNHYLDLEWLEEAYYRLRRDSAPGWDGQTVQEYGENLRENLEDLLKRAKSGTYKAPPVRRSRIPKEGSQETRLIGIPTVEDKVLQKATLMLLEPIYEQEFKDFSYGFRPGRSTHQALEQFRKMAYANQINWVLDVDIRKYFDTIDHGQLRTVLSRRVQDGVIRELIDKWLKAGILEAGKLHYPEEGTPQGGIISPMLSNLFLHEVLDQWFEEQAKPQMKERCFIIRFADDAVLGFESKEDAEKIQRVIFERFRKYGLTLHPEKTKLVNFGRPGRLKQPESFDFLGFTHYWGWSHKGKWVIRQKTSRSRFTRGVKAISRWCRAHRHDSVWRQAIMLHRKLRGHYNAYGIRGNYDRLERFRREVINHWRRWLNRRGGHRGYLRWEQMARLVEAVGPPRPKGFTLS